MKTLDVLGQVLDERVRQDVKWGEQNHPDGTGPEAFVMENVEESLDVGTEYADNAREGCEMAFARGDGTWRDILLEEVFEALAESDPTRLREELVQIAAVAVSWVQAIDRRADPASA